MSWSIGFDDKWNRDIGYGVPCVCDHPGCNEEIDRGLAYVCGGEPYGGEYGCGLFFCYKHLKIAEDDKENVQVCERCFGDKKPFNPKEDIKQWIDFKMTDESWAEWRKNNNHE